jgi:hypothetical protein
MSAVTDSVLHIKWEKKSFCNFQTEIDLQELNGTDMCRILHSTKKLKKLCGFSPQANYTDRATAACSRS